MIETILLDLINTSENDLEFFNFMDIGKIKKSMTKDKELERNHIKIIFESSYIRSCLANNK